ncbi:MAG: hypothetical protein ACC656_01880, partial [Candidatus Heimdallarchaeota archaeon]
WYDGDTSNSVRWQSIKVGASFFGFKGGGSWTRVSKTLTKGGTMEIRAIQSGGKVLKLGTVVGLGNSTSRECDFSNVAECTAFADRLMSYATTNFPAQLESTKTENAIRTYYSYYRSLGLPAILPYPSGLTRDFSSETWGRRIDMLSIIETNFIRRATAGRLTAYYKANRSAPNAVANITALADIKVIIDNRYPIIESTFQTCWTAPGDCISSYGVM